MAKKYIVRGIHMLTHQRLNPLAIVAYNRVALTEYFQHRNVEKLYLNKGASVVE